MKRIGDYTSEDVTRLTPLGFAVRLLGIGIAVALVLGLVGFAAGWFRAGTQIISPENVKAQWQFAYDFNESLTAIGQQWCTAKAAEDAETNSDAKLQRTSQRISIEQNYARVKAQYDARLADAFRAKLVKPDDVPKRAPTLAETTRALDCP